MKHLAGLKLSLEQYTQLAMLCDSQTMFPSGFEEWQQLVSMGEAEALEAGDAVQELEFEVAEFVAWCRLVGIVPCLDAIRAYSIVQRLGPGDATYAAIPPKRKSNGDARSA